MRDLPWPKFELTFEQNFELAKLTKGISEANVEEVRECCYALLKHNYILKNTLNNLIHEWYGDYDDPGADD